MDRVYAVVGDNRQPSWLAVCSATWEQHHFSEATRAWRSSSSDLLTEIQRQNSRTPVIVMTAHTIDGFGLSKQLFVDGATELVAKPFEQNARPLPDVIRSLVADPTGPREKTAFAGGEHVLFDDHAELCGVTIISDRGEGIGLAILRALAGRDANGRRPLLSAEDLAARIGADSSSQITAAVRTILQNVVDRLKKSSGVVAGRESLIRRDRRGYSLVDGVGADAQ